MAANELLTNIISKTNGADFFHYLNSKSTQKSYDTIYEYLKYLTQEISPEQSFYVLDLADILRKIQLWREKLPGITPFYAVKANADPVLIRLLILLGFSFDCSTKGEIDFILKNGGKPENIIYAHTVKPHSSLLYASKIGVDLMTFDSKEELFKIHKYFPNARLILRIKSDTEHCFFNLSVKYGCPVLEAKELLIQAKNLHLNVIGVSFHVGALCTDLTSYAKSIHDCRMVFTTAESLGFKFTILDIGGGFHGSTMKENFFDKVTTEIKEALTQYFPDHTAVNVIAEPGCYFVGSAQRNVTCVLGKKFIGENVNDICPIQMHYFLNETLYGSFFKDFEEYDILAKPLLEKQELIKRPVLKSKLWGQTCSGKDFILEECLLPEVEAEEYIVWENTGAYCQAMWTIFTLVPFPAAKHVFINQSRLQLDWVEDLEAIAQFLLQNAVLIKNEDFDGSNLKFQ